MKTMKTMAIFDKSAWPDGPWRSEPDRVEFVHAGFPCLLKRVGRHSGHWCGYVGVPPGHPMHGVTNINDVGTNVHGGITYADACDGDPVLGVCHVPAPGEPEHAWWLGFDAAHAGDVQPLVDYTWSDGKYRTVEFMAAQTRMLAEELKR